MRPRLLCFMEVEEPRLCDSIASTWEQVGSRQRLVKKGRGREERAREGVKPQAGRGTGLSGVQPSLDAHAMSQALACQHWLAGLSPAPCTSPRIFLLERNRGHP